MHYARFDQQVWPCPLKRACRFDSIVWDLTHEQATKEDLLLAASIVRAYAELVRLPLYESREKLRRIRQARAEVE